MSRHQTTANKILAEHFEEMPADEKALYLDIAIKMNEGFYKDADYITQVYRNYTHLDAYAFIAVKNEIASGRIGIVDVVIGSCPVSDSKEEENNKALEKMHPLFKAECWGGSKIGADGVVHLPNPLHLQKFDGPTSSTEVTVDDPADISLEIGLMDGPKMFVCIESTVGVFRWPYNRDVGRLFYRLWEK